MVMELTMTYSLLTILRRCKVVYLSYEFERHRYRMGQMAEAAFGV